MQSLSHSNLSIICFERSSCHQYFNSDGRTARKHRRKKNKSTTTRFSKWGRNFTGGSGWSFTCIDKICVKILSLGFLSKLFTKTLNSRIKVIQVILTVIYKTSSSSQSFFPAWETILLDLLSISYLTGKMWISIKVKFGNLQWLKNSSLKS